MTNDKLLEQINELAPYGKLEDIAPQMAARIQSDAEKVAKLERPLIKTDNTQVIINLQAKLDKAQEALKVFISCRTGRGWNLSGGGKSPIAKNNLMYALSVCEETLKEIGEPDDVS